MVTDDSLISLDEICGRSSAYFEWEVLSTKYSYVSSSGVSYTNLVTAGYVSEPGDSGGLVYTYMSNGELRETTGVNHGHANHSDGTYAYAIFSKASSINSALSIERY